MLVLSRKKGESIMLGKDIEINIVDLDDGKVRIGINAPKDIEILRKELFDQIIDENKDSKDSKDRVNKINKEVFKNLKKNEEKLLK